MRKFFVQLVSAIAPSQRHTVCYREYHFFRDDSTHYLEGATDLHDLERRMRRLYPSIYPGRL